MKPTPKKLTKQIQKLAQYRFNDDELLQLGKELAERSLELSAIEQDKKRVVSDFAARIAGKESEVSIASNKIQSGYEYRDLPHTVEYNNPVVGRKTITRDDTKSVVSVEAMTQDELQMDLAVDESNPALQS